MGRILRKLVLGTIFLVLAVAVYDLTQPDSPLRNLVESIQADGLGNAIGQSMRRMTASISSIRN